MRYRLLGPILALLAAGVYLGAELYLFESPAFPLDDSWIHLQFARQLSTGDGLTYNMGERVSGSTAPLWTALLSLGFLLPDGLPLLWPKLLGLIFLVMTVFATGRLAESLDLSPWFQRLAEVMIASTHWWLWSALSGMEILLFSTLSLWGLVLYQRESDRPGATPISIAVLAAACLARPEGLLLLMLALLGRLSDSDVDLRSRSLSVAIAAIILIPTLAAYQWIGDSPLPSTFHAKTQSDWNLLPDSRYLWTVLHVFWTTQPILTLLALGGCVHLTATLGTDRPRSLLPALWLLGQPLAYAVLSSEQGPKPIGNFGRYYFPLLPILIVLGLLALKPLANRPPLSMGRWKLGLPTLLAVVILTPQLLSLWQGPGRYLQTVANVEDSDVQIAKWLKSRLPAGTRLGVQDIGALKFFLQDHYVVDLAGIVTPEIRPILHSSPQKQSTAYWEAELAAYLQKERVDYLILFSTSYPVLSNPGSTFKRLHELKIENNVTMAGDHLVVLKTPWSTAPDLVE